MSIISDTSNGRRRLRSRPTADVARLGSYAVFVAALGFAAAMVCGIIP